MGYWEITDPTVRAFLDAHSSPPQPRCVMLVDASGTVWSYEHLRHAWVSGDAFWRAEERKLMDSAIGPLREVWI